MVPVSNSRLWVGMGQWSCDLGHGLMDGQGMPSGGFRAKAVQRGREHGFRGISMTPELAKRFQEGWRSQESPRRRRAADRTSFWAFAFSVIIGAGGGCHQSP